MRRALARLALLVGLWLLTVAATAAPPVLASPSPTPTPIATPTAAPTPAPTPTPASAGVLALQPSLGAPGTTVTVQGRGFRKGEQVTIYWDSPEHSFGQVTAGDQGEFKLDVKVPEGDPGQHQVCPLEPGPQQGCGQFKLEAAAPSPSPSPSATTVPTPSAAALASPLPTQVPDGLTGQRPSAVAALLRPPFVIFPILVLVALLGGCAYWIWLGSRGRRPAPVAAATVTHRSLRPAAPVPPPAARPPALAEAPPAPPAAPPGAPDLPAPRPAADGSLDLPQPGD